MKINILVTAPSSTQFRVVSIEKIHSTEKYCVRGRLCKGKHPTNIPRGPGAYAEYLAEYQFTDSPPPPSSYNVYFCESCLANDIGWLRMEKIKSELKDEM